MTKNKNNAPLKGSFKYKQIMKRYGKRNPEPVRKVVRVKELPVLSQQVYTSSNTGLSPVAIEYSYIPAQPKKTKNLPSRA